MIQYKNKQKTFSTTIDANGDNQLNFEEFKTWFKPSLAHLVDEEAIHVFKLCDSDRNRLLNKTEVLKCCSILMKSQLTDFGIELEFPLGLSKTEELKKEEL